ncbi:MAG: hypothetical protein RLY43_746 [Bacteroidota bacterium]|jgi:hypothetical protein
MKPTDKLKELHKQFTLAKFPSFAGKEFAISTPNCIKQVNTTNGLTKCIIAYIRLHGWQAERISTSGRVIDRTKVVSDCIGHLKRIGSMEYIPGTGTKGSADVSATIAGQSIKIEVKNKKTKDKQSGAQKEYGATIDLSGGVYFLATDFDMFTEWFDANYTFNPNYDKVIAYTKMP